MQSTAVNLFSKFRALTEKYEVILQAFRRIDGEYLICLAGLQGFLREQLMFQYLERGL